MRRLLIGLITALALAAIPASQATAAPTDPFIYQSSIDGAAIGGLQNASDVVVNRATGNLLIFEGGRIDQFDANGNPVDFSATGSPSLQVGGGETIAVDNSGGPTQGNIYVFTSGFASNGPFTGLEQFWAFSPSGEPLAANPQALFFEAFEGFTGSVGVGPDGKIWAFYYGFDGNFHAGELTTAGKAASMNKVLTGWEYAFPNPAVSDGLGNFYLRSPEGISRYDSTADFANEGETGLPVAAFLAVDPSTNDVYARQGAKILGVHYSDPLVKSTPFELLDGVAEAEGGIAFSDSGETLYVAEGSRVSVFHREQPSVPYGLGRLSVGGIRTDQAVLTGQLSAGVSQATYHFEYGTDTNYGTSTPEVQAPFSILPVKAGGTLIEGLQPNTTYHARLVATNSAGTTYGPDRVFKTYPTPLGGSDSCPNALARKQTGAAGLPDCRAYELVSARDSGGYEVESSLVPGQKPFGGYPEANGRVLYATHAGAVPGPWHATNRGPDPYLATRGVNGWSTSYLGLPSDLNPASGPFSSVLGEADAGLNALAFAGAGLCSPCFSEGIETGIPVRLPNGQLVQGMAGSLDPGVASAMPEGKVGKYFSADGKHLVFASKYAFEPGANDNTGDLTVYERDLGTGETVIVSTTTGGQAMTGAGISELDISADGSRVLFGQKVSSDSAGNEYLHPYLHLAGSQGSVDLAPTSTSGVLYAGMSSDGSKVFFTSKDALLAGDDTDASADLYEADVDSSGNVDLSLVSDGNSTSCDPVANSARAHWNSTSGTADCGAVAIGGGGGVASQSGAVYFLSPEQLDGSNGTLDQPNLYRATSGGSPSFIATLEPNNPLVLHSVSEAAKRQTGDFQASADGAYAVFVSDLPLSGADSFGFSSVFRYDANGGGLACASCDTTDTSDSDLGADALLAPNGLSLTPDGRVFFSTRASLALNDANHRLDVYEWGGSNPQLISSGGSPFDSGLLSVSANGTDAYFFTHERLAPSEDQNSGTVTRIYDARTNGGFFAIPGPEPCAASDECHGPGSQSAPSPPIRTGGPTTPGNQKAAPKARSCRKGQAKKKGRCVAKKRHAKKHHTTTKSSRGSH